MTNLTEKWKKGELPAGWYYIKFDTTDNLYITFYEKSEHYFNYCGVHIPEKEITSILAPVPSFEQWQAKLEENSKLREFVKELRKALQKETPALRVENAKLKTKVFLIKGLLNKWLPEFDCYNDTLTSQFCKEARQVLGEE